MCEGSLIQFASVWRIWTNVAVDCFALTIGRRRRALGCVYVNRNSPAVSVSQSLSLSVYISLNK